MVSSLASSLSSLLPPSGRPAIMGVLNITPDSFSDGGQLYNNSAPNIDNILQRAEKMVADGVDIFDVGGESTRPGATAVPIQEELARVVPVVKLLKQRFNIPVSVDTSHAEVIEAVAGEGASLINDVRAFTRPKALAAAINSGLPMCLMHMVAEPTVMQNNPTYSDVVTEVEAYLLARVKYCLANGAQPSNLIIDPGFGFGKTLEHNLALFNALPQLASLGFPLLVGVSRKKMVGQIINEAAPEQRITASVTLAVLAAQRRAAILRVHDVKETHHALTVLAAVAGSQSLVTGETP